MTRNIELIIVVRQTAMEESRTLYLRQDQSVSSRLRTLRCVSRALSGCGVRAFWNRLTGSTAINSRAEGTWHEWTNLCRA